MVLDDLSISSRRDKYDSIITNTIIILQLTSYIYHIWYNIIYYNAILHYISISQNQSPQITYNLHNLRKEENDP